MGGVRQQGEKWDLQLQLNCPWSAFIYFIAVYIMLCQNQSGGEVERHESHNNANILGETLPMKIGSSKEPLT